MMLLLFRAGDNGGGVVCCCCCRWSGARAVCSGSDGIVVDDGDEDDPSNKPLSLPPLLDLELHPPARDDAIDLRRSIWSEGERR